MEAMLAPKVFAGKEFDKYVKTIRTFFMATGRVTATDQVKLAILLSVGGTDMEDLFKQVGKVNVMAIDAVEADIARGIEADDAIAADTFEAHAADATRGQQVRGAVEGDHETGKAL